MSLEAEYLTIVFYFHMYMCNVGYVYACDESPGLSRLHWSYHYRGQFRSCYCKCERRE